MRLSKEKYNIAILMLKKYNYNKINKSREAEIVEKALLLVDNDSNYIFKEEFCKKRNKWDIMLELGLSDSTYKRRRKEIIYAVNNELSKLS